jgi:hypothetical protein
MTNQHNANPKDCMHNIITNLACNKLIMKIMRSLFIHSLYILHMNIMCWKHIWHINKCVHVWSMNLWMNKCHVNFASSYKYVCQMCFQCMISMCETYKLWMEFFSMTSITKLWDVKFVMIHHKATRTTIKDESIWPSTLGKWYVVQLHTLSFHVWPPQPTNNNTPKGRTFCTFKITNPTITYNIINLVYYKYK